MAEQLEQTEASETERRLVILPTSATFQELLDAIEEKYGPEVAESVENQVNILKIDIDTSLIEGNGTSPFDKNIIEELGKAGMTMVTIESKLPISFVR